MASSASDSAASIPSKDLKNALSPMASQWRELGVQFGFRESDLDGIQQSHPAGGVNQWLRSMLEAKIDSCPGFSWNDVLAALETLGQCTLAEHIRRTFCISHSPTAPAAGSSSALSELMEENDVRLRDEFADLLVQACKQFEALVTPEAFRTYTRTVFVPAPFISTAVSIREMVGALTDHGRWNYLHYRSLLRLVRRFDRNRELEERCRKYEKSVAHFKFTTRIKDWIVKRNITNDSSQQSKLLPVEYSRLSAKVKINVTDERLGYVMKLWNSIAEHLFELPDLDAVLHNMKEECLLVTWLIPNSNELRDRIRENAPHCSSFFDQHRILYCLLDNECLYKSHEYDGNAGSVDNTKDSANVNVSLPAVSSSDFSDSARETTPLVTSRSSRSRSSFRRRPPRSRASVKAASRSVSINTGSIDDEDSRPARHSRCCGCVIL